MLEINLNYKNAIDPYLHIPPNERELGGEPHIETKNIRLRIGERPVAYNLKTLYELNNRKLPKDIQIFESYKIWVINHNIGVIKEGGYKSINKLGYRVQFPDKPKVTVIDILPQSRFIKKLEMSFKNETDIQINGQVSIPDPLVILMNILEDIQLDAKINIANHLNIVGRFSFSVISPTIQAVGVGDRTSEWLFTKEDNPLVGNQNLTQIILTPRHTERLKFKSKIYTTVSTFNLIPSRLESEWIDLECELT